MKIDFSSNANNYRRLHGGGAGQPIAKAIGLKKYGLPLSVIDATAGLAQDSFVLASLGCSVTMIERNPQVTELLEAALSNADPEIQAILNRMRLVTGNAIELLSSMQADVVYIDPMFPQRNKTALVKQNMRDLKQIVGADADADQLLEPARKIALKRVVVKRPKLAGYLANLTPHFSQLGKSGRFDIYMPL